MNYVQFCVGMGLGEMREFEDNTTETKTKINMLFTANGVMQAK